MFIYYSLPFGFCPHKNGIWQIVLAVPIEVENGQILLSNFWAKIAFEWILNKDFLKNLLAQNVSMWCPSHTNSVSVRVLQAILSVGQPNLINVWIYLEVFESRRKPFSARNSKKMMCPFFTWSDSPLIPSQLKIHKFDNNQSMWNYRSHNSFQTALRTALQ